MKDLQPIKALIFALILSVAFTSCTKEDIKTDTTNITIKLKSIVGNMDKVYINIEDVQLKMNDGNSSDDWVSLNSINRGIHNTSDLGEDNTLLLVDDLEIEAGYIHEYLVIIIL